jgi:hypothetical protein
LSRQSRIATPYRFPDTDISHHYADNTAATTPKSRIEISSEYKKWVTLILSSAQSLTRLAQTDDATLSAASRYRRNEL